MVKNSVVVRNLFKYACGNRYPPDEATGCLLLPPPKQFYVLQTHWDQKCHRHCTSLTSHLFRQAHTLPVLPQGLCVPCTASELTSCFAGSKLLTEPLGFKEAQTHLLDGNASSKWRFFKFSSRTRGGWTASDTGS